MTSIFQGLLPEKPVLGHLFSGSNFSPEKSLQKILSIFGLENQSCDRRHK